MNESIIQFIKEQTFTSICCVDETGKPYCFSCFYAFNSIAGLLYFKSSAGSHHAQLMKKNPFVAGTILPDKLNQILIKGIPERFVPFALIKRDSKDKDKFNIIREEFDGIIYLAKNGDYIFSLNNRVLKNSKKIVYSKKGGSRSL